MYVILVGHTGLGKGRAINPAVGLLRESGCANILSDKLTIQYILEKISDRGQQQAQINMTQTPGGPGGTLSITLDSSCFISAAEIEDLFTTGPDPTPPLKELWECKDGPFEYGTRGKGLVKIAKPCPTMLGGCTPSQIAQIFPTKMVGGGFVRRCNFVYAADKSRQIPWPVERNGNDPTRDALINDLRHIAQLRGRFAFDPIARQLFERYYVSTNCDEFQDEATASYETSRPFHALKLAMSLTLARNDDLVINFVDMQLAINMVNQCCEDLKKVFRAVGDSEMAVVIDKVLRFIEMRNKQSYVTRQDILAALWRDVGSSQQLDVLLATLEAAGAIKTENRSGITIYKPVVRPKPARTQASAQAAGTGTGTVQ